MAEALITGAVHINTPVDSMSGAMAYLQDKVMAFFYTIAASVIFFTEYVALFYP